MRPERHVRHILGPHVVYWLALVGLLLGAWPTLASAQEATPAVAEAPTSMQDLFGLVPASLPGFEDPTQAMISYADLAMQLETVGVDAPERVEDEEGFNRWATATQGMALPSEDRTYLKRWRDDYGFDLLQVDQVVSIDLPPAHLALYRGSFDPDAVRTALQEIGYRKVTVEGYELLSIRGDFEIDVKAPTTYRLAAMNFGTVLPDGTLAFASSGASLAAVLDVVAGTAPSMLEMAGVAALIGHAPGDLVTAMIVDGFALELGVPPAMLDVIGEGTPDLDAVATDASGEIASAREMPPIAMALLGFTAGDPIGDDGPTAEGVPTARAVALLQMLDPASAEAAVPVVEQRLEHGASSVSGAPYAETFAGWSVVDIPGSATVIVDLEPGRGVGQDILFRMFFQRDLGFLAW